MHEHWERKKYRSKSMTNSTIDEFYQLARANGAVGGKLIGAGGGGFLMLYTEDKTRLRHALREAGLREVRMRFDFEGTMLVTHGGHRSGCGRLLLVFVTFWMVFGVNTL